MKRTAAILAIFAVLIVILIIFFSKQKSRENDSHIFSGTIEAVEIDLAFKSGGRIEYVKFDEGDIISKADTASELDHKEINARIRLSNDHIAAAEARLRSMKVEKQAMERNLKKLEILIPAGGATEGGRDDLQDKIRGLNAKIDAANSEIKAAISQKDLLLVNLENEYLVSPVDGRALVRSAEPGEIAIPGQTVLTIIDPENLKIKIFISEDYLGKIKIGQEIGIKIDSHESRLFNGQIARISDKAEFTPKNIQTKKERVKTVYAVTITTGSQGGILKSGMPCDVIVPVGQ